MENVVSALRSIRLQHPDCATQGYVLFCVFFFYQM